MGRIPWELFSFPNFPIINLLSKRNGKIKRKLIFSKESSLDIIIAFLFSNECYHKIIRSCIHLEREKEAIVKRHIMLGHILVIFSFHHPFGWAYIYKKEKEAQPDDERKRNKRCQHDVIPFHSLLELSKEEWKQETIMLAVPKDSSLDGQPSLSFIQESSR